VDEGKRKWRERRKRVKARMEGGMKQLKVYRVRDDGSLIEWFSNSLSFIV
jgi:hypothetical protein